MITKTLHLASMIAVALAMTIAGGCTSSSPSKPPKTTTVINSPRARSNESRAETPAASDGCDARLQDISGLFLLYNMMNHRLPESVDELHAMPGAAEIGDFSCPISKKPYIYNPAGLSAPSGTAKIILYDPAPSHGGMRLCVSISESKQGGAMVTKVIALPESFFKGK